MNPNDLFNLFDDYMKNQNQSKSSVPINDFLSKQEKVRPNRNTIINSEDINNLKIALETMNVDNFIKNI